MDINVKKRRTEQYHRALDEHSYAHTHTPRDRRLLSLVSARKAPREKERR